MLSENKCRAVCIKILLFTLPVVIIVLAVFTLSRAGRWLVHSNELAKADAIVILVGSMGDRILEAEDIYSTGYARQILIVNENQYGSSRLNKRGIKLPSKATIICNALMQIGIDTDDITVVQYNSTSTLTEAIAIRDYLKSLPQMDTIILVSSAPHLRRASMIFSRAMQTLDREVVILSAPSKYTPFDAGGWWRDKEDIQIVLMEYIKLMHFLLIEQWKL